MANPFVDDTRTWTDPKRGFDLSDRVWAQRADMRESIDRILREGIVNGTPVDLVAKDLETYVRPTYARFGSERAEHAANRLVGNEYRRANAIATQQVSLTDPLGGYLKYTTSGGHIVDDECSTIAGNDSGYGRGVYQAKDVPMPPIHVGCLCQISPVKVVPEDVSDFVEQLRVEYGLDSEPTDLSAADLLTYRKATSEVRDAVQFLFRGWFDQVGLVSREQLLESSESVASWVSSVRAEKQARRALRV